MSKQEESDPPKMGEKEKQEDAQSSRGLCAEIDEVKRPGNKASWSTTSGAHPPQTSLRRQEPLGAIVLSPGPGAYAVSPDDTETGGFRRGPVAAGATGGRTLLSNTVAISTTEEEEASINNETIVPVMAATAPIPAVLVTPEAVATPVKRRTSNDYSLMEAAEMWYGSSRTTNSTSSSHLQVDNPIQEAKPVMSEEEDIPSRNSLWLVVITFAVLLSAICLLILGLLGMLRVDRDTDNASFTLKRIQQEGVLRAGYYKETPAILVRDPVTAQMTGLVADLYEAIAAAAGVQVEYVLVPGEEINSRLVAGEFDVSMYSENSMENDINEPTSKSPLKYAKPFGWAGLHIFSDPFYFDCAGKHMKHVHECSGLRVCVDGNEHSIIQALRDMQLPERLIVVFNDTDLAFEQGYMNPQQDDARSCTVLAGEKIHLQPLAERYNYQKDHIVGMVNAIPHSAVTSIDDPIFSDFVESVIQALFAGQLHNITQDRADDFPQTLVFGKQYRNMFREAIRKTGNYIEIFHRNIDQFYPQETINFPHNGSGTGLLLSYPLGDVSKVPAVVSLGSRIPQILGRGALRCGVVTNRPGFVNKDNNGSWTGMDIDYCKALAASLFQGDSELVDFIELEEPATGYTLLASGDIDVMAGATWTLETQVQEPTTEIGFDFSLPYYYGYSQDYDNFCLATMQDDHFWSTFVFWIATAPVYAEESGFNKTSHNQLPEVYLYGTQFHRMLRDAVLTVGSYADIYEQNVEQFIPRSGRNKLNLHPHFGPQMYVPPGYI